MTRKNEQSSQDQLIVVDDDNGLAAPILRAIDRAVTSFACVDTTRFADIESDAAGSGTPPSARVIVFWPGPEYYLCARMDRGLVPNEAIAEWTRRTGDLLAFLRPLGDRGTLIRTETARRHPEKLRQMLREVTRHSFAELDLPGEHGDEAGAMSRLIAARTISQSSRALALKNDFVSLAVSPTPDDAWPPPNVDEAFHELSKPPQTAWTEMLENQLRALRQEMETLNQSLREQGRLATESAAHARSLEADIAALLASSSWRITRPLRRLKILMDRIRGRKP